MKKLTLLFAALVLSFTAQATVVNCNPGTNNLSWYLTQGDTLVLADGEYIEHYSFELKKEGVVVMAAEGAKPIIKASYYLQHKATTTFIGITFDGQNTAEYATYSYENTAKDLKFVNCEFMNYTQYTISASSSAHVDSLIFENCVLDGSNTTLNTIYAKGTTNTIRITDSEIKGYTASCVTISSSSTSVNNLLIDGCTFDGGSKTLAAVQSSGIINTCEIKDSEIKGFTEYGFVANSSSAHTEELSIDNCIIHDCGYAAVYVCKASDSSEKQSCSSFKLTNSTIYNVGDNTKDHGAVDIRDNANIANAQQVVLINHVTLYNFNTRDWYGGFMIYQSPNATISNCIVSNPADLSGKNGYHIYGNALVTNSLYNNCSVISGAQEANNIAADPLFVDAANGNFQLYAESPAIGLGDPRWGVKPGLQPGSGKLKEAVDAAQPGETIELGDETYEVSTSIDFDVEGLTIKAAEGTKPIIKTTDQWTELKISASTTFEGITFDGGNLTKVSVSTFGTTTQTLTLKNCEFKNYTDCNVNIASGTSINTIAIENCVFDGGASTPNAIYSKGIATTCTIEDTEFKNYTTHCISAGDYYRGRFDNLSINNCLFHDSPVAVYMPKYDDEGDIQTCANFSLTNSTIYNMVGSEWKAVIDLRSNPEAEEALNKVVIDHITLYNFTTTELGGITSRKSTDAKITNSIIANPADNTNQYAYRVYGAAAVQNTLCFNTKRSGGNSSNPLDVDPLFVDAANGNFDLYANSPAVNAGTDGKTLGDPRWDVSEKTISTGKRINVTPDQASSLPWMIQSDESNVKAGDTIVLADGQYTLSTIEFIKENLVVMAAENAKPEIISASEWANLEISANTTFDGITFNGNDVAQYLISIQDSTTMKTKLVLQNCELKNWKKWAISNQFSDNVVVDSLIVDNCLFHDGTGSAIRFNENAPAGKNACEYFKMTNTTLYNIVSTDYAGIVQISSNGEAEGDVNTVIIDHITLYNFDAASLGAISIRKTNNMTITNSIIATPEDKGQRALYVYGGTVDNTIHFNGSKRSGNTVYTKCENTDPLFVDAANGNFMVYANSPAIGKATDGSNLGDPRWGVKEITLTTGDNSQVIADNINKAVNVKIERSFTANDGYYTLCVPFNMPASVIGKAYSLGTITKHVTGEGININLEEVKELSAGMPYLVLPKANMSELVVENVTIAEDDVAGQSVSNGELNVQIYFQGYYSASGQTNGTTQYYVGNNGYLYNDVVDIRGLCGLFTITDTDTNPINIRARVVTREEVETGLDNNQLPNTNIQKVLENGQLIIIRDGVKYNVQGQVIK